MKETINELIAMYEAPDSIHLVRNDNLDQTRFGKLYGASIAMTTAGKYVGAIYLSENIIFITKITSAEFLAINGLFKLPEGNGRRPWQLIRNILELATQDEEEY